MLLMGGKLTISTGPNSIANCLFTRGYKRWIVQQAMFRAASRIFVFLRLLSASAEIPVFDWIMLDHVYTPRLQLWSYPIKWIHICIYAYIHL